MLYHARTFEEFEDETSDDGHNESRDQYPMLFDFGAGVHVALALDPSDAANGGFEVLGRTHTFDGLTLTKYDTSTSNGGVFDLSTVP